MGKWDINRKPPMTICPERYCWFWSGTVRRDGKWCELNKCRESFRELKDLDCIRSQQCKSNAIDWYEPCEPELRKDGLPDDYFVVKRTDYE